jgi:hypothetical protein
LDRDVCGLLDYVKRRDFFCFSGASLMNASGNGANDGDQGQLIQEAEKLRARLAQIENTLGIRPQMAAKSSGLMAYLIMGLLLLFSGLVVFFIVAVMAPPRVPVIPRTSSKNPIVSDALPTPNPAKTSATSQESKAPVVSLAAPAIKHPLDGRAACLACHGEGKARQTPTTHADRTIDTCMECHRPGPAQVVSDAPSIGGAPPAPADHAGRSNDTCAKCHDPAG